MRIRSLALLAALTVGSQPNASTATFRWEPSPPPDESTPPNATASVLEDHAAYLTLDRTLFEEGDIIQGRAWRMTSAHVPLEAAWTYTLIDGNDQTRLTVRGDEALAMPLAGLPGGVYTLRATTAGLTTEREITIAAFEPPRMAKELMFLEASYEPGDEVAASLQLRHAMGGPVAGARIVAELRAGRTLVATQTVTSDAQGEAMLMATLPHKLPPKPVRWHLAVTKGAMVEATSRQVPVATQPPSVRLHPEGGTLVAGIPSRLFVQVQRDDDTLTAASGQLVDDLGTVHGVFETADGLARLELTPEAGRSYQVRLLTPHPTTSATWPAANDGCTLRSFVDTETREEAIRVAVQCSKETPFKVSASLLGKSLQGVEATATPGRATVLHLALPEAVADRSGVVRVDLGPPGRPWARRMLYRHAAKSLEVALEVQGDHHGPGDEIEVRVTTTDPSGRGVPATLALGVIDDLIHEHIDVRDISLPSAIGLGARGQALRHPDRLYDNRVALDWFLGGVNTTLGPVWVVTQSRAVGQVLTKEFLRNIPTGRSYQQAVQTVAGVGGGSNPNTTARIEPTQDPQGPVRQRSHDTLYFDPHLQTDANGHATVRFTASDALSTLRLSAEGVGDGWLGHGETTTRVSLPLSVDTVVPRVVRVGDVIELPVSTVNRGDSPLSASVRISGPEGLHISKARVRQEVQAGTRHTDHVRIDVKTPGAGPLTVRTGAGSRTDAMARAIQVIPVGYDNQWTASGRLEEGWEAQMDLSDALPSSIQAVLTLHPSPVSSLMEGVEGMLREPHGCFEQASSANYPNVMVLDYLRSSGTADAGAARKARELLERGYAKLTRYESAEHGYEWFGRNPGHEALTAYGLTQFLAMQRAWGAVDDTMIARTKAWLLDRRNGTGGYHHNAQALDTFGHATSEVTDAYITWSLVQAGEHSSLGAELKQMQGLADNTRDPYLLSLATHTLALAGRPPTTAAARLAAMQDPDGSFPGAGSSITRSGGMGLQVETTALAALALMEFPETQTAADRAIHWLLERRSGATWGSTQATILALQAVTHHAQTGGSATTVRVMVDGKQVSSVEISEGQTVAARIPLQLRPGPHHIELRPSDNSSVTVAAEVRYSTAEADGEGPLHVTTELSATKVDMGEPVQLVAVVRNDSDAEVPSPLVRVHYPAGLEPDLRQLRDLEGEQGLALVETRPGEIALYLQGMGPHSEATFNLGLHGAVPGRYTSAPSTAYPYYEEEATSWAAPTSVQVRVPSSR